MLNYEKRSPKYDFPLTFERQKKINGIVAVFPKKKKRGENYTNGGMVWEPRLVIFEFFSMLNYGKRSLETDFSLVSTAEEYCFNR